MMTTEEIATKIVSGWMLGHTPEAIMMALLMRRTPMSKEAILQVIRRYCDACNENGTYRIRKRLRCDCGIFDVRSCH